MSPNNNNEMNNEQYAQQWIDFLRKRNGVLNVIWPALLTTTIVFALAAFYFFQNGQTVMLDLKLAEAESKGAEAALYETKASLDSARQDHERLKQQFAELEENSQQLSVLKTDTESKMTVNTQIIDNLQQQVELLKSEKTSLSNALQEVRSALASGDSVGQVLKSENQKVLAENSALSKSLQDRKGAYVALVKRHKETQREMDRLGESVAKLESENKSYAQRLNHANSSIRTLEKSNNELETQLSEAKVTLQAFEEKMDLFMAPIGTTSSSAGSKRTPVSTADQDTSGSSVISKQFESSQGEAGDVTSPVGDGLEEMTFTKPRVIKSAPKSQASATKGKVDANTDAKDAKPANFDFDQISIN